MLMVEAIVVGLMVAILGTQFLKKIEFTQLFILGLAIHLLCEVSGINKWYCKNGNACK